MEKVRIGGRLGVSQDRELLDPTQGLLSSLEAGRSGVVAGVDGVVGIVVCRYVWVGMAAVSCYLKFLLRTFIFFVYRKRCHRENTMR